MKQQAAIAAALGLGLFLLSGCTSTKTSSTARTGIEQLLVSNAVDQALDKVDFRAFQGQKVFVDEKYIDCVDKAYLLGSLRHRIARTGGQLVAKAEEADIVLEIRSGGVGTDTSESFLGIPEIFLPGMVTLPEVRIVSRLHQTGTAKIALVAYDAKSMKELGDGGISLAKSDDNNWFVFGVGPYQNGSIRQEVHQATTGPSQVPKSELPTQVAFATPATHPQAANDFQFTSGIEENGKSAVGH